MSALFVDGDEPLIVDGQVARVIGTNKQCKFWDADGRRCTRPKVAGGLCKAHKKEAECKARFDLRAGLVLPERKHFEYAGNEDALVEK